MSDLNRKQFEKYAKSKGWEDRQLKQRDDGGYEDWGVHPIWLSWQASRECLLIDLPDSVTNSGTAYIETIRAFIEKQGIKTK